MIHTRRLVYAEMCRPLLGPTYGLFSHIALHKKVLYAGGEDGTLSQMVVTDDHVLVTATHSIGSAITSLSFNPSHHKLAISCSVVSERCSVSRVRHHHHHHCRCNGDFLVQSYFCGTLS